MKTITESERLYLTTLDDKDENQEAEEKTSDKSETNFSTHESSTFESSSFESNTDKSSTFKSSTNNSDSGDSFEDFGSEEQMMETPKRSVKSSSGGTYSIMEKQSNQPIGTFSYKVTEPSRAEISYSFNKDVPDQGYGYELINAMVSYLGGLGLTYLTTAVKKEDPASMKLLMKTGFKVVDQNDISGINTMGRRVF